MRLPRPGDSAAREATNYLLARKISPYLADPVDSQGIARTADVAESRAGLGRVDKPMVSFLHELVLDVAHPTDVRGLKQVGHQRGNKPKVNILLFSARLNCLNQFIIKFQFIK